MTYIFEYFLFRNKDNTIIKYTSIIVLAKKIILQM